MRRIGRLTSAADFRRTYKEGRRASSHAVAAHVLDTGRAGSARVGVTAARGLGRAVERNRAKRRLREALRRVEGDVRPGTDVVLIASPEAVSAAFQDVVDSLRLALERAGGCR